MRKLKYKLAEEILRRGGSDEEIQRRIMEEFPDAKENPTRANWYRRSWIKYGHCRGNNSSSLDVPKVNDSDEKSEAASSVRKLTLIPLHPIAPPVIHKSGPQLESLEEQWLDYSWKVLTGKEHIEACEGLGGRGIEDPSLRWPGYLGKLYQPGGLVLIANIHRNFASGGAGPELAAELVRCTKTWRNGGRSPIADAAYLAANRACYLKGLQLWNVGNKFEKFMRLAGVGLEQVTYLNAARCQSMKGACDKLQRLCLERFPMKDLIEMLQPKLILTCSTKVRDSKLDMPVRWFHQWHGTDQNKNLFEEWSIEALKDIQ